MCRIQVLKRGRWDFFSALRVGASHFFYIYVCCLILSIHLKDVHAITTTVASSL